MYIMCPFASGFDYPYYIMNGDTLDYWNGDTIYWLYPGSSGMMYFYCDSQGVFDWIPDSTFYFIGNPQPQICVITSDSNNHPVIYLDTATIYGNYPLHIQRQITTTSWQTVKIINLGDPLVPFVDTTANTTTQIYYYKLQSHGCEGYQHRTIHLQANGHNLIWNEYWPNYPPLRGYYIHKRDINGNFSLIDSTVSLTYTDLSFQDGDEYFVEAFRDDVCPPVIDWIGKRSLSFSIRSNKLKIGTSGIHTPELTRYKYTINGNTLYVELEKPEDVGVYDLLGREIVHVRTDKLTVQLKTGIYLLNVGTKGQKIIIY
ncbi:MAG TPA: hypothetical protein VNJ07_02815 [Chitinophagales bacterium]|nr:hypothetical protein [Chitinophagales bacterium]